MQKTKKTILTGLAVAIVLSAGVISSVSAYRGDYNQKGPNYSPERHVLMQKAFETNDYNLWKSQMGDRGATRFINENNFAKFSEAHRLASEGKYAEAGEIRKEMKLGNGQNGNCGYKNGEGRGMQYNR